MSQTVKGFVAKINRREVNTRRGPRTSHSVKLQLDNGTEYNDWISTGFDEPDFSEGDYVKIVFDRSDRGFLDATSVKVLDDAPERPEPQRRSGGNGGGSKPYGKSSVGGAPRSGGGFDPKGPTIHYQNSRTAAIELVGLMLEHDALPISGAQTKAGTAKRYDEVLALVNKLTVQFFFDVETLRLTKSVADAGAEKAAKKDVELDDDADAEGADDDSGNDDDDDA